MRHLDLFSGIGGFALACRWAGVETIGFSEIDKYLIKVLKKNFPGIQNYGDITKLDGTQFKGIELITGGFPCQPFSVAGKQRGSKDDRHLWPEMLRVITQARPAWAICENVVGIVPMELDTCSLDLENEGYSTRTFIVPACAVDACHQRKRIWIVAHSDGKRQKCSPSEGISRVEKSARPGKKTAYDLPEIEEPNYVSNSDSKRELQQKGIKSESGKRTSDSDQEGFAQWPTEPGMGRVAYGIPKRVDKLRGLGNAVVPQVVYEILRVIKQLEENET